MKGNIPKDIDIILVEQLVLSMGLLVLPCSTWKFEVTHAPTGFGFTVDLEKRTCTCLEFQMLGLLCRHAIAAASPRNMDYNMFVSEYHVKQTWAETLKGIILPIPDPKDVFVPAEILKVELYPPMTKRTKGKPCIKRKLSAGEFLVKHLVYTFTNILERHNTHLPIIYTFSFIRGAEEKEETEQVF